MIGREIGTYKILEKIGEGGMGVVYKGMDAALDRPVAIKILIPELAHNPALVERFRSEAKAQANLNHTNIATLYAFLQIEGQCLIVMELLRGETFEELIFQRGKVPWKGAVSLTRQALQGLGFAHRAGTIHRDVKPSNLMLTNAGIVKVMDFGIAKVLGSNLKTSTGARMGTAHYMSPEQIRGLQIDARSDIYSLGVTLYQLLSGDLPFKGDSDFDLMSAHVHVSPPGFANSYADVPEVVEQCVLKALAKDPAARFQSADERARSTKEVAGVLCTGLLAYLVSFALQAIAVVNPAGQLTESYIGWFCAVEALVIPWKGSPGLLAPQGLTPKQWLHTVSLLIAGLINVVFIAAMLLKIRRPLRGASAVLAKILLTMIPFCWVVFALNRMFPREGYAVWTCGMMAPLFPGEFVALVVRRRARKLLKLRRGA